MGFLDWAEDPAFFGFLVVGSFTQIAGVCLFRILPPNKRYSILLVASSIFLFASDLRYHLFVIPAAIHRGGF